jgi:hypothetical protein
MNRKSLIIEIGDCLHHAITADGIDDLDALQKHCAAGEAAFGDLRALAKFQSGPSDAELVAPLQPEIASEI